MTYDLIVVGGGAAGFFAAIEAAAQRPKSKIIILEKTSKLLSKVRISGGGRCNVTHHCFEPTPLSRHYPRGQKELKQLFKVFQARDTAQWFERRGVPIKTEDDGRMFPLTDQSQTIIDCLLGEAERRGIEIATGAEVTAARKNGNLFTVSCRNGQIYSSNTLLAAMGGHPQAAAYQWIEALGHSIVPPIPSLFTFNDPAKTFADLMGVAVQNAEVRIAGTKYAARGPVLITHWGLSGPACIRLSAWAAKHLHDVQYNFTALVNWTGSQTESSLRVWLQENSRLGRRICSHTSFHIPQRLWEKLCENAGVTTEMRWSEAPAKVLNRLIEFLIRCPFQIHGKTTFKEEFVTCGGVDLKEVDINTMQSKKVPGFYLAGEVLNIDGETGGFNFQSAWTTAFVAAQALSRSGA